MRCLWLIFCILLTACASSIQKPIPKTPKEQIQMVIPLAKAAAQRHNVPFSLILGLIHVESGFQPDARSLVGACGLMQLMPKTAEAMAKFLNWDNYEIHDPAFNIEAGTAYLAQLLNLFNWNYMLALAAYNAGPARVSKWIKEKKELPEFSQKYAEAVLASRDYFEKQQTEKIDELVLDPPKLDREGLRDILRQKLADPEIDESED